MTRATWPDLKRLRASGKRPRLPVIITDRPKDAFSLFDLQFLVIVHESGTPFPVEVLRDLDVVLMLDCAKATKIAAMFRERDAWPASCRSWCACEKQLTVTPERSCSQREEWPDA